MFHVLQLREEQLARPVAPSHASYLPTDGHATAGVPRSRVQNATATHVWITETDEFDPVSDVRYRIER